MSAWAQSRLTLTEAVTRARAQNLDVRSAELAERQAVSRLLQARAGYLPSVDVTESWQRGNQPVYVFSSLLAQRQFAASNFVIDALNRPQAVGNFRAAVTLDQAIFDPAITAGVRAASVGREAAAIARAVVSQGLGVTVTGAYGAVLSAEAATRAATAAVEAATVDLELARNRRDAGMVTDADVLQIQVYLARSHEQEIRGRADVTVARARLNLLLGEPLDTAFTLDDAPEPAALTDMTIQTLETSALAERPELKLSALQEQLAAAGVDAARAAFLPRVSAQAAWEANGGTIGSRASSWVVGAVLRVNVFRGLADRAKLAEARDVQSQRALDREKAEASARLEVREALARLDAARAADAAGRVAVEQARESHRIIRDRYEGGLADVSALLQAAEAVQQANARQAAARVEVVVAAATLKRAAGTQ
ncbi:MAG: TolC family protein [Acidobacteriota bacterium]